MSFAGIQCDAPRDETWIVKAYFRDVFGWTASTLRVLLYGLQRVNSCDFLTTKFYREYPGHRSTTLVPKTEKTEKPHTMPMGDWHIHINNHEKSEGVNQQYNLTASQGSQVLRKRVQIVLLEGTWEKWKDNFLREWVGTMPKGWVEVRARREDVGVVWDWMFNGIMESATSTPPAFPSEFSLKHQLMIKWCVNEKKLASVDFTLHICSPNVELRGSQSSSIFFIEFDIFTRVMGLNHGNFCEKTSVRYD